MYDTKIELFLKGGNVITLEAENEKYGEYDFEQLKRIFESNFSSSKFGKSCFKKSFLCWLHVQK